ncbi:MAG: TonB-dependent receptor [Bacteroidales bacterium]|nr:TonB-dependent receptor [Bacteroidales bacterium]
MLNLRIFYEGQEIDRFTSGTGALAFHFHPGNRLSLKIIGSAFITDEQESYDILGEYWIDQLDNGAVQGRDSALNLGVGTYLNHARNNLLANVYSLQHKGTFIVGNNQLKWGIVYKKEIIDDEINEWDFIDSVGYSIPYTGNRVSLFDTRIGNNTLATNRLEAYFQNTFTFLTSLGSINFTTGIRSSYWDYNNQVTVSPRLSASYRPGGNHNISYKAAFGIYHQPPFYKELRDQTGLLYQDVKAQESYHYVLGSDYTFMAGNNPFKLSAEVYYKYYDHLIPYKLDNIRIQYYPQFNARGYATGVEVKLNGDFVPGTQSWLSLSLLQTKEDVIGDYYFKDRYVVRYTPYGRFL